MRTKLDPKDAQEIYDKYYIGESQNGSFCAEVLDVSLYVLTSAWQKLKLDVRTREQERQAAKQRGRRWEWPEAEAAPVIEPAEPVIEPAEPEEDTSAVNEAIAATSEAMAKAWASATGEPALADALEAIPALEVGEKVAFLIGEDGRVSDVSHGSLFLGEDDPGPGRRPIEAKDFNELVGRMRGDGPVKPAANGRQIDLILDLPDFNDRGYFHPLMADIARLTAEFDAAGIPANKAARLALKAAELAAGRIQL